MTVTNIIKSVRWCIDEEAVDQSNLVGASSLDGALTDISLMDNIIKNRIGDALRWVCLYAPTDLIASGSIPSSQTASIDVITEETKTNGSISNNLIALDGAFVRLIRVRGQYWHRAILGDSLLSEDSPEYLQLHDTNGAEATVDRPQAALILTKTKGLEVWPVTNAGDFKITYIVSPNLNALSNLTDATTIGIPSTLETSFIYYLAYLVLSAYGDPRAKSMLEIATMNLKIVK